MITHTGPSGDTKPRWRLDGTSGPSVECVSVRAAVWPGRIHNVRGVFLRQNSPGEARRFGHCYPESTRFVALARPAGDSGPLSDRISEQNQPCD